MGADSHAGRYRPIYWAYFTLLAWIGAESPLVFYLGNLVLLIIAVLLLYSITRKISRSSLTAGLTAGLFLLAGPVIENTYTLSKGELLQVVLLLIGLRFIISSLPQSIKLIVGVTTFTLTCLVKETGLVIIPISAGWLVLGLLIRRINKTGIPLKMGLICFIAAVAAGVLYFFGRSFFQTGSMTSGSYANGYAFTLPAMAASFVRWSGWIIRDFPHLFVLGAVWLSLLFIFRRSRSLLIGLAALIWMAGWIAIFLPWVYMQEYYLLPFTAGASFFMGEALTELITLLQTRMKPVIQWMVGAVVAICGLLMILTLLNNYTSMRVQLLVDKSNHAFLEEASRIEPDSQVFLNIQQESEYSKEIAIYLDQLYLRPDLDVKLYQGDVLPAGAYTIVPIMINQPRLTVRLGLDEPTQRAWNNNLEENTSNSAIENIYTGVYSFQMLGVDLPRLLCSLIKERNYCANPSPLFDQRIFQYGWEIRRIEG